MFFENDFLFIEREDSQIPWIKIFTKEPFVELTDCPQILRNELWQMVQLCEQALREFYKPDKINIASFANYVPRVHFHIMARFKDDEIFSECMWGKPQREFKKLDLPEFSEFIKYFHKKCL